MGCWRGFIAGALCAMSAALSSAQSSAPGAAGQMQKTLSLGGDPAQDLERKDGVIKDPVVLAHLQGLEKRLAAVMGSNAAQVRLTRASTFYVRLLPHNMLYISGALLERIESEAELAGLLAHQLAHAPSPVCVLGSQTIRWGEAGRETERAATEVAIQALRTIGYDPSALLDLFSKLAYEHPAWASAIVPEDLLSLRAGLDNDMPPQAGYLMNSSQFLEQRARVSAALGHAVRLASQESNRPTLTRR